MAEGSMKQEHRSEQSAIFNNWTQTPEAEIFCTLSKHSKSPSPTSRVPVINRSYLRRWRRFQHEVEKFVQDTSSDEQHSNIDVEFQQNPRLNEMQAESISACDDNENRENNLPNLNEDDAKALGYSYKSDSSTTDDNSVENSENVNDDNLCQDIAAWATKHKNSRAALNDLLHVFRKHGHRVPKDSRTLLQTPRHIETIEKCGGSYFYVGIESGILKVISQHEKHFFKGDYVEEIKLNFKIDGLPLFKSSNTQFWPILCSVDNFEPFIVALFCGIRKPNSVQEYLSEFLEELQNLLANEISYEEKSGVVKVQAFVCDAPARAFFKIHYCSQWLLWL
ncbi:unnamed protein product [Mytilus coruscus]|uniref:MULE transposase domain-containing protein n=1 Tax=Mytilus coruscus TaxID=42192 RepID=A0A6J7ZXS6_MYTCO|nr:unnamed protein product [Mytilus coruscus]